MADGKIDLGKLLGTAKKKSEAPATPEAATADATPTPPTQAAPAASGIVAAGLDISKLMAKPAAAKSAPALQAPQPRPAPAQKPLPAPMPSNPKLERQVSTRGMRVDRLNVEQKEARKYPYLCFGVDEIFVALMDAINIMRRNIYRAIAEYPRFIAGAQIVGAVRRDAYLEWDGSNLSPILDTPPGEPTAYGVLDSDAVIDNIRGKMSCSLYKLGASSEVHGDNHLAHLLGVGTPKFSDEEIEIIREREEAALATRMRERKACKTPIDWLQRNIEMKIASPVRFIDEPLFFRVTVEHEPKQELLFHIEKRRLTVLVGKPGETLVAGAFEVTVSPLGLAALWDMECAWPFLFTAGLARATGEVALLAQLHWVNPEIVRRINILQNTKALPGADNGYWLEPRLTK